MIKIYKSENISDTIKSLKLGILEADNINVTRSDAHFDKELQLLEAGLLQKFNKKVPSQDPIISATRKMYRQVGWEPTRYRPSSEALVRRLIRGKGLYRINNLVDYGNLVSARFHIPMGLYDMDKVKGTIQIDVGDENESYEGISKVRISAAGKIILRDQTGIFGNPTADSKRTSIQKTTKHILAVFFISSAIEKNYAWQTINNLKDYYLLFSGGDIKTELLTM